MKSMKPACRSLGEGRSMKDGNSNGPAVFPSRVAVVSTVLRALLHCLYRGQYNRKLCFEKEGKVAYPG